MSTRRQCVLSYLHLWYEADAVIQGNLQDHFVNEAQLLQAKQPSNPDESAEQAERTLRARTHVHTQAHTHMDARTHTFDGDKLAERSCLHRHI